jgi:hypothetical protein
LARVLAQFGWTPYYKRNNIANELVFRVYPFPNQNAGLNGSLNYNNCVDKSKSSAKEIFSLTDGMHLMLNLFLE